ncbi:MAG: HemK/PrmC family methyltransferase [bacterium]
MTRAQALSWAVDRFINNPTARLDAEVLLAHSLRRNKTELYARPDWPMTWREWFQFKKLVYRRRQFVPVAYLTGHKEFFELDLRVSPAVLIPRPATEAIVHHALELIQRQNIKKVCDVGTGSGAIAIAIAKSALEVKIIATDISSAALKVAQRNAAAHQVSDRVEFIRQDLLPTGISDSLIIANLPYLPNGFSGAADLDYEPGVALWGRSDDGLELYRRLFDRLDNGQAVIELGPNQFAQFSDWLQRKFNGRVHVEPVLDADKTICGLTAAILPARPE